MDENDDSVNNMVSNLPLLFANGYPTSLEKITESQIQKFIPFMVQCSLGNINVSGKEEYNEPEWWPEDIEFSIPIARPKKFQGDWLQKMKDIVKICYQFHKSIFLLRFCSDLAAYEHTWLRFINNQNSTTSLYDRRSNKLLVTFRNENMTYDQPPLKRKCLLQQKTKNTNGSQQQMVEQAFFDIYLCEYCDAELYSYEACKEHEKNCTADEDDDDVILCNSPVSEQEIYNIDTGRSFKNNIKTDKIEQNDKPPTQEEIKLKKDEQCRDFLLNFQLISKKPKNQDTGSSTLSLLQCHNNNLVENKFNVGVIKSRITKETNQKSEHQRTMPLMDENKIIDHCNTGTRKTKITRNNRTIYALTRCPNIPFSSPAGQMLIKTFRSYVNDEYLKERLDRVERFCATPLLQNGTTRNAKCFSKQRLSTLQNINCTYKKPLECSAHRYTFPRRQFFSQYRVDSLKFLSDLMSRKHCRPLSVRLKKFTETEIKRKRRLSFSSNGSCSNSTTCTSASLVVNSQLNIKLIRDQSQGSPKWKITQQQENTRYFRQSINISNPQNHKKQNKQEKVPNLKNLIVVDTIDLCSSDEELGNDDNQVLNGSKRNLNDNIAQSKCNNLQLVDSQSSDSVNCDSIDINYRETEAVEIVNVDDDDMPEVVEEYASQPVENHPIQIQSNLLKNININGNIGGIVATGGRQRIELQAIIQKLNKDRDITVTPLRKVLGSFGAQTTAIAESSVNLFSNNNLSVQPGISTNLIEEIRKQNKFEANFLTANQPTNPTKPLQPSMFLFSNYTANSNSSSVCNISTASNSFIGNPSSTTVGTGAMAIQQLMHQQINKDLKTNCSNTSNNNNQENLISQPTTVSTNIINKINRPTDTLWLPNNNHNTCNSNISNSFVSPSAINNNNNSNSLINLKQNQNLNSILTNPHIIVNSSSPKAQINTNSPPSTTTAGQSTTNNVGSTANKLLQLQLMQYVENGDVLNKITSPNRTVSIDLT